MTTRARGHHEGSIRRRPDLGAWEGRVSLGYRDGHRVRQSVYGKTRAECAAKVAVLLRGTADGAADERRTLRTFAATWTAQVEARVRPGTARRYRELIDGYILPTLGGVRLARLTPAQVSAALAAGRAAGAAPRTLAHARAVLRTCLGDAVRWGLLTRNAAALSDAPRVPVAPIVPMTPEEARAILAATEGHWLGPIVATALYSGARQGEVLALQWRDVDLIGGTVRIRHALQRVDGRLQLVETKSASSRRMIPMAPALAAILTAHRAAQAAASLAAGSAWMPTIPDLCFPTATGAPRDASVVTHTLHARLREAGCPDRRFHDLRHGAATLLLAAGSDLKTVSTILGHSQISLTANTYAAVLPALTGAAVGRLDALLRADSDPGGGKVGGKPSAVA